ncbi:MAG TPA: ABC transporter substrate-binding protein [Trueperaceae bacterium]
MKIELRQRFAKLVGAALLAVTLAAGGTALAQDCGGYRDQIVLAEGDWDSVLVHNAIASFILEEGFGCDTRAIPGSTIPTQQGMIRGDIDLIMEVWMDNLPDFTQEALDNGQIVNLGVNFGDGQQGFFVPRYVIEGDAERGIEPIAPDLRTVEQIAQYAHHFRDPEQPEKGRFFNCIIGWVCEEINTAKLEAYGLSDDFTNFRPGTGAALAASIERAYVQGEPWFGYYWGPTWVLGKYDMVQLEEPDYTEECWNQLMSHLDNPETACAYPPSVVNIMVNSEFAENAPAAVIEFLESYETTSQQVSDLLSYMQENDSLPRDAAMQFLESETDTWTSWLPDEVAQRVMEAL